MNKVKEDLDATMANIINLPISRWQEYKEIRLRALKDDPQAFFSSHRKEVEYPDVKWQERLQSVVDGNGWTVFAEIDSQLIGMLGAYQKGNDRKEGAVNVFGVFVAKEARGKGVAFKMMEKLLEQLKQAGIIMAKLTVNENQSAAVALYKKLKFKVTGQESLVLGDGIKHIELIMEKKL